VKAEAVDPFAEPPEQAVVLRASQLSKRTTWRGNGGGGTHVGTFAYAMHRIDGGLATFLKYVRLGAPESETLQKFLSVWDGLSQNKQRKIPMEQLCEAAGVTPSELLGEATEFAHKYNGDISNLIAAEFLPSIVQASVRAAQRPRGVDDRRMLMQHAGFVPISKGSTINIMNRIANQVAGGGEGLPSHEERTLGLAQVIRGDEDGDKDDAGTND